MTCHIPVICQSFPEASCCIKGGKLPRPSETGSLRKRNQEVVTNPVSSHLDSKSAVFEIDWT